MVYWVVSLMVFGGGRGGTIDFVYNRFFYFTVLITLYLVFKYSVHYFFFLRGPLSRGGRSVGFLVKQVFKDSFNTPSLPLRFYCIFVDDSDEDGYLSGVFVVWYGLLLFMSENDYDTSNTSGGGVITGHLPAF